VPLVEQKLTLPEHMGSLTVIVMSSLINIPVVFVKFALLPITEISHIKARKSLKIPKG
jgi:hypothetical protein